LDKNSKGIHLFGFNSQFFPKFFCKNITFVFLTLANFEKCAGNARNLGQNWLQKQKLQISFKKKIPLTIAKNFLFLFYILIRVDRLGIVDSVAL